VLPGLTGASDFQFWSSTTTPVYGHPHVTYRKRQKTIEAWGDVSLEEGSGKQERFDAALFKIDSGTLAWIKLLDAKERTTMPK
jgi:hypothetical protein